MSSLKMLRRLAVVLTASLVVMVLPASAPAAQAAYCGIHWGSLPKASNGEFVVPAVPVITNVRTGRHACFDRLVVDLRGRTLAGYRVEYRNQVVEDGSGNPVPLRGGAKLQIVVVAPAHDDDYRLTFQPANQREVRNVAGYSTFRQVAWAGTFEGQTTVGLGVRARLPFRTFVLDDGTTSRIVIDVAHRW